MLDARTAPGRGREEGHEATTYKPVAESPPPARPGDRSGARRMQNGVAAFPNRTHDGPGCKRSLAASCCRGAGA